MKSFRPLFACALAALVLAAPPSARADSIAVQRHGAWSSRVVVDDDRVAWRAATASVAPGDGVALTLDRLPGRCDELAVGVNVVSGRPAARSVVTEELPGSLRIDRAAPRALEFVAATAQGERIVQVRVVRIEREARLPQDLAAGRALRLKLALDEAHLYAWRFPLAGVQAALGRTLALCRAGAGAPDDADPAGEPDRAERLRVQAPRGLAPIARALRAAPRPPRQA